VFNNNTDKHWETYGRNDPYFGVITDDKFRSLNLTDENREEFFRSGEDYIAAIFRNVRRHIAPEFAARSALDFGCGVGRLLIPLAGLAQEVTGIDVSESMLQEARKNCDQRRLSNVSLVKADDSLSRLDRDYDFIHSYIVFQHIPVERGERIFAGLLKRLAPGGVGVVHFTYAKDYKPSVIIPFIKKYVPFANNIINWIKGEGFVSHDMQMNAYDLNHILLAVQKSDVSGFYAEFTHFVGELGLVLYFRKHKVS